MKKVRTTYSWALSFLMIIVFSNIANADSKKLLTATEITTMISGNTLSGVFGEKHTRYAQRNHKNGMAVVHVEGSAVRLIPWFVKESGFYCEDWSEDGVLCYQIAWDRESKKYYLIYPDGTSAQTNLQKGFHPITFK